MILANNYIKTAVVQLELNLNNAITEKNLDDLILNLPTHQAKISKILSLLDGQNYRFVVFPEYSYHPSFHNDFIDFAHKNDCVIISGTYITQKLVPQLHIYFPDKQVREVQKSQLAPAESTFFQNIDLRGSGILPNIYQCSFSSVSRTVHFLILICYDFYINSHHYYGTLHTPNTDKIDLIVVPSLNKDLNKFYISLQEFPLRNPSFCLYSNTSNYGGSAVFGIHENTVQMKHINRNLIHTIPRTVYIDKNDESGFGCNLPQLIFNLPDKVEMILSSEVDIDRPYLIRPYGIASNNLPNVMGLKCIQI